MNRMYHAAVPGQGAVLRQRASMIALVLTTLMLTACATPPDPEPIVIDAPVDAFNAVDQPYTRHDGRSRGGLSTDVERLQNARRLYELSLEQRGQAVEHRQQRCLEQSGSRRVPVQGAAGGFVFCEPGVETAPATGE